LVRQLQNINYAGSFFQKALQDAKTSQACSLCRRDLDDHELCEFTDRVTPYPFQKQEI
jgi:hypothetical protein